MSKLQISVLATLFLTTTALARQPQFRMMKAAPAMARVAQPISLGVPNKTSLVHQIRNFKAFKVYSVQNQLPPHPGNAAYRTNNGVTLFAGQPRADGVSSWMEVFGVKWDHRILNQIKTKPKSAVVNISTPVRSNYPEIIALVRFLDVSTEKHLYMLSIGTTAKPEELDISFDGGFRLPQSQMHVGNKGNRIQALLSVAPVGKYPNLVMRIAWKPKKNVMTTKQCTFHYVQLVQMD